MSETCSKPARKPNPKPYTRPYISSPPAMQHPMGDVGVLLTSSSPLSKEWHRLLLEGNLHDAHLEDERQRQGAYLNGVEGIKIGQLVCHQQSPNTPERLGIAPA